MKILGTGLTGLVGTRFTELLGSSYEIEYINTGNGISILDKEEVLKAFISSDAPIVLHMAAKTNVDDCEDDKKRDKEILSFKNQEEKEKAWISESTAWAVNVFGTQNIIEACKKTGKKIFYVSTDFIFDGTKRHYSEEGIPNPINWYAKTKFEGEKLVLDSGLDFIITRLAYPYRAYFEKNDFVRAILEKLSRGKSVEMITDHIIVPTFIDDFVNALDVLIQREESGIFNTVGSQALTPYEVALKIAHMYDIDETLVLKTTRKDYFKGKASRPFCLNLKNDKISHLGIEMSTFDKGLIEIKNQREKMHI